MIVFDFVTDICNNTLPPKVPKPAMMKALGKTSSTADEIVPPYTEQELLYYATPLRNVGWDAKPKKRDDWKPPPLPQAWAAKKVTQPWFFRGKG